jgi:hypothetical protein
MKRYGAALLAGLLTIAAVVGRAFADPIGPAPARGAPARVILRRSPCEVLSLEETAFARLIGIELAADGVTDVNLVDAAAPIPREPTAALAILSLEGGCDASAPITVVIDDAATDKSVRRIVDLGDLPREARARALSLAAAELLRASWAELVLPGAPPPRAPVPPLIRAVAAARVARPSRPPLAAPSPPSLDRPRPRFDAMIEGRLFFGTGLGMVGGRLGASIPLPSAPLLRLRFDAGAAHGGAVDPLGEVNLWLASGALGLRVGVGAASAWIEAGPRLELGAGFAEGRARPGFVEHRGATLVAMASMTATGGLRLGAHVACSLELELGPVLRGFTATADARTPAAVGGLLGTTRLGLAWTL